MILVDPLPESRNICSSVFSGVGPPLVQACLSSWPYPTDGLWDAISLDHVRSHEQNRAWNLDSTVVGMLFKLQKHQLQRPGGHSVCEQIGAVGAILQWEGNVKAQKLPRKKRRWGEMVACVPNRSQMSPCSSSWGLAPSPVWVMSVSFWWSSFFPLELVWRVFWLCITSRFLTKQHPVLFPWKTQKCGWPCLHASLCPRHVVNINGNS